MPMIAQDKEQHAYYMRKLAWFKTADIPQREKDRALRDATIAKLEKAAPKPKKSDDNEIIVRKIAA